MWFLLCCILNAIYCLVRQTDRHTYRHDENITSTAYAGGTNKSLFNCVHVLEGSLKSCLTCIMIHWYWNSCRFLWMGTSLLGKYAMLLSVFPDEVALPRFHDSEIQYQREICYTYNQASVEWMTFLTFRTDAIIPVWLIFGFGTILVTHEWDME